MGKMGDSEADDRRSEVSGEINDLSSHESSNRLLYIRAQGMFHPLVEEPVTVSFDEDRCMLVTGSNASGKSTFLKTVAINAILAQTIATALAERFEMPYTQVATSMALADNIIGSESYYIVEIKSLKRILDRIDPELPMLCFVDEVLRGTNTKERIAASAQILERFAVTGALCVAATHDLELTHILENVYSNYHFTEQVSDGDIIFDYTLRPGRSTTTNAIKLLDLFGFDSQLTQHAQAMADGFEDSGQWPVISG
jgi:DNA mismatch repair ATPase MutS